jgi:hypothetical protein
MATSIIFHISYIAYTHSHVALYSEWPYIVVLSVLFLDWPGQDSPSPPPYLWPRAQAQLGRHCVHCKLCRPMPWPQNSLRIPRKGRLEGHYRPLERGTIQVPFCGSLWILVDPCFRKVVTTLMTQLPQLPCGCLSELATGISHLCAWNIKQLEDVGVKIIS